MEYRYLGRSGLQVPVLSLGTGTFGGRGEFFGAWGNSDVAEAKRLVDICLDAGVTMFDSADIYSRGAAEEILGQAIKGRRDAVLISTKATSPMSDKPNDAGSSRQHLTQAIHASLGRLQTDYIDLFQLHNFDAYTPIEEVALHARRLRARGQDPVRRRVQLLRLASDESRLRSRSATICRATLHTKRSIR